VGKRLHDPIVNIVYVALGCAYESEMLDERDVGRRSSGLHEGPYGAVEWCVEEQPGSLRWGYEARIGMIDVRHEFEPQFKLLLRPRAVVPMQSSEGCLFVCGMRCDAV